MINEIKYLYPTAVPLADFTLQDNSDGSGPFIAKWDEAKLGPKPTKAELDAVSAVAEQARIDKEASDKAKTELASIDLASVRAIREYIVAVGLGVGLAKEVYDSRKGGTGFDKRDLAADALGVATGLGLAVTFEF